MRAVIQPMHRQLCLGACPMPPSLTRPCPAPPFPTMQCVDGGGSAPHSRVSAGSGGDDRSITLACVCCLSLLRAVQFLDPMGGLPPLHPQYQAAVAVMGLSRLPQSKIPSPRDVRQVPAEPSNSKRRKLSGPALDRLGATTSSNPAAAHPAADDTLSSSSGGSSELTPQEKKLRRKEANRQHARASRERQKNRLAFLLKEHTRLKMAYSVLDALHQVAMIVSHKGEIRFASLAAGTVLGSVADVSHPLLLPVLHARAPLTFVCPSLLLWVLPPTGARREVHL